MFLGRSVTQHKQVSDVTAHTIDEEVRALVDRNYERARGILEESKDKLHLMADALMKYETIDEEQIKDIMQGREPRTPGNWVDTDGDGPGGAGAEAGEPGSGPDSKVGGPASQH